MSIQSSVKSSQINNSTHKKRIQLLEQSKEFELPTNMGVCDIENNVAVLVTLFLLLPIDYRNVDLNRDIVTVTGNFKCYVNLNLMVTVNGTENITIVL